MAFRRRRTRFRSGPKRKFLWTGNSTATAQTLVAGTANTFFMVLVSTGDYQVGTAGSTEPGGVTLARIVGSYSFLGGAAGGSIYCSIIERDPGIVPFTPNSARALYDGNVLFSHVDLSTTLHVQRIDFDVKVKRRLEQTEIVMMLEGVAASHSVVAWARAGILGI